MKAVNLMIISGIIIIAIGICGISLSQSKFYNATDDKVPLSVSTNSTNLSFKTNEVINLVNSTVGHTVFFDINGIFVTNQSAWLRILTERGDIIKNLPVSYFPVNIYLENSGQYIAVFDNVFLSNNAYITAYSPNIQETMPYANTTMIWIGLSALGICVFTASWGFLLFWKGEPKTGLPTINNYEYNSSKQIWGLFIVCSIFFALTILIPFQSILASWVHQSNYILAINSAFICLLISYTGLVSLKINKLQKMTYERLSLIERTATMGFFITTFGFLIAAALFILEVLTGLIIFYSFGADLYFVSFCTYLIYAPFILILSKQGRITYPLRQFINQYKTTAGEADYSLLSTACRRITKWYNRKNLMISSPALTLGLSYSVLTKKNTEDVESILSRFDCEKTDDKNTIDLLKRLTADGCDLEAKGIKTNPSFIEKYSKFFGFLATLLMILTGIAALLHL